ncbi:MAG: hypothetical protein ABIJ97_05990 [Bacteroidota bacterium]
MKKLAGLLLAAGILFMFSSCKKDWTCECTISYSDSTPSTTITYTINDVTKKDAQDACGNYSITAGTATYACDLK